MHYVFNFTLSTFSSIRVIIAMSTHETGRRFVHPTRRVEPSCLTLNLLEQRARPFGTFPSQSYSQFPWPVNEHCPQLLTYTDHRSIPAWLSDPISATINIAVLLSHIHTSRFILLRKSIKWAHNGEVYCQWDHEGLHGEGRRPWIPPPSFPIFVKIRNWIRRKVYEILITKKKMKITFKCGVIYISM
jgi:hypothetical protein